MCLCMFAKQQESAVREDADTGEVQLIVTKQRKQKQENRACWLHAGGMQHWHDM